MNTKAKKHLTDVPFHIPSIGTEEIDEVISALQSGWLTTGPRTKLFETKFAEYIGVSHALAVNSCTAGMHVALVAHNIGPGDEVITSTYTFAATAAVIIHSGAKPILVDIEKNGFNIDIEKIESAITERTKAIIPVHFAGEACDMEGISRLANKHKLHIIEDAAHALGSSYKQKNIGSFGNTTAFSFYATKNMTTGEGGMVTTDTKETSERMRRLSLHGLSRDAWNRYSKEGKWYYEVIETGFKYNMSDIQAAIGLKQLDKFDALQRKRSLLAQTYQEHLQDVEEIILPSCPPYKKHAWHLFVIRIKKNTKNLNRDLIINQLGEHGIGTSVHFIPLHLQPYYRKQFGYKLGDFPKAEQVYFSAITLPLYPQMSTYDVEYVVRIIKKIISTVNQPVTIPVTEGEL